VTEYPYFSPIILTDPLFLQFGGQTGTSTVAQRQAAYLLAEEQVTEHLNTFLLPTTVTGTYQWNFGNPFELDYGHLLSVTRVTVSDVDWANSCQVDTATGCSQIRNARYGYIDVSAILSCGGCGSIIAYPYNVQVVYESGLYSGTSYQPSVLAALSLAAQINLNEWDASLANEGTADIGIQSFSNQSYSENRVKLGRNAFGSSASAQRIGRLINKYRSRPGLSFHR
jgi:hypothetical protein